MLEILNSLLGRKKPAGTEDGNPSLVKAMREVALSDKPENRKKLYQALLDSMLLVPVPETPEGLGPGLQVFNGNIQIQLTSRLDRDNLRVTPAFTDAEALRTFDPNTPFLGLKTRELFRLVMGTDIQAVVINPYDPIRKMIRPGGRVLRVEMDLLAKGVIPSRIGPNNVQFQFKAKEKLAIGLPANPPSAAIEDLLRSCASALPEVCELYLFQMATQSATHHAVIGISLSGAVSQERAEEITDNLGQPAQKKLEPGQSLDFVFLRCPLADQVRKAGKQIFRKT